MQKKLLLWAFVCFGTFFSGFNAQANSQEINIYSARHYQTDEELYDNFTQKTGIKINRVDAKDAEILARLKAEGAYSLADVILLVDATRLWQAEKTGLFLPIQSSKLQLAIPANLRAQTTNPDETSPWFGFSKRARIIVYDPNKFKASDLDSYEKLVDPKFKDQLCIRSGSHPYNLSLFGAMLEHLGPEKTEAWLQGLVNNMARAPKGGDTDQIKAVASGECGIAITNSYYLARLMRSQDSAKRAVANKVAVMFPNQNTWGTHVNIAGGAVAKHSKNPETAIVFLEYLASPQAQSYFANGNNEWPAVPGVALNNPALEVMGANGFKSDITPISTIGKNQFRIQQMLDRVGFQ